LIILRKQLWSRDIGIQTDRCCGPHMQLEFKEKKQNVRVGALLLVLG
jgi:hypothetical protein